MKNKLIWIAIGVIILVTIGAVIAFMRSQKQNQGTKQETTSSPVESNKPSSSTSLKTKNNEPPLLIKSMPVAFGPYDPQTKKAGDFVFSDMKLEHNLMYFDYGHTIPANSVGPAKQNPQPTFIVPLGTKVKAITDGVVVNIPTLYSNDYSIMIAESANSNYMYEMEHVINPTVKVGDKVTAGQVVAEVSDYDSRNTPGYGLVEMGILKGGTPPQHLCPFNYLDPSIKETVQTQLKTFYKDWNSFKGQTLYDESASVVPGCITLDPIDG